MYKPAARPGNVVNLMDALRRSIEDKKGSKPAGKKAPTARAEPAPKRRAKKSARG
jgi:non-homologous end joining protein Ku